MKNERRKEKRATPLKRTRLMLATVLLVIPISLCFAGSSAEESSGNRAEYLAGRGIIAQPRDVGVWEFISAIDYGYPDPEGDLGVYAHPGQYQVSNKSQEVFLSIGVQAARRNLESLPPLNIAFVVDTSGSMGGADKINWVRDSLEVFEETVRNGDTISLVSFDTSARVLLPTMRIRDDADRRRFLMAVRNLEANGSTNLYAGLELGFAQLLANLSSENVNRIVLLSDGLPTAGVQAPEAFRELVQGYRDVGVSVSAIGLGTEADLALIRDIGHWSSGTSRFIDDRKTMEETFGLGLGRLIVPVARDVVVDVRLAPGVSLVDTWGYDYQVVGSTVTYTIPALHDSDYETIVANLTVPESARLGEQRIATVETSYLGGNSTIVDMPNIPVDVERVDIDFPVVGITDAMALRSAMMLRYGQLLVEVGQRYYDGTSRTPEKRLSADVAESLLRLVTEFRFEMENAELRLDEPVFTDELAVLKAYQEILAGELQIAQELRNSRYDRYRQGAPTPERAVSRNIDALVSELRLSMRNLRTGRVAVLGIAGIGEIDPYVAELLVARTYSAVAGLGHLTVASGEVVASLSQSRAIDSSDLADASLAARLGRDLEADYVVTGMVIASPQTIHLFERVIRTSDGEVLSAAQIMMPR